jgi:hypothetical protein
MVVKWGIVMKKTVQARINVRINTAESSDFARSGRGRANK